MKYEYLITKEYLITFVNIASVIYGPEFIVFNVHNLYHLANDVTNMNCSLLDISAFNFENCLGKIKKKITVSFFSSILQ